MFLFAGSRTASRPGNQPACLTDQGGLAVLAIRSTLGIHCLAIAYCCWYCGCAQKNTRGNCKEQFHSSVPVTTRRSPSPNVKYMTYGEISQPETQASNSHIWSRFLPSLQRGDGRNVELI